MGSSTRAHQDREGARDALVHAVRRATAAAAMIGVATLTAACGGRAGDRDPSGRYDAVPLTGALAEASVSSGFAVPHIDTPALATPAAGAGAAVTSLPAAGTLTDDALYAFIVHHATVHYANTGATGNLPHWRGGRPETLCPRAVGLDAAAGEFVAARIRALATEVGAPVRKDADCRDNVRVIFTAEPERVMAAVVDWASTYFGVRFPGMRPFMKYRGGHAVQGWYFTTPGGGNVLNMDVGLLPLVRAWPIWPQVIPQGLRDDRDMSGIVSVILVVDTTRIAGTSLGTIADYVAMLALTVVQAPDHCDALPSILDAFAPTCAERAHPSQLTAVDRAFLEALYYRDTGLTPSLTRLEIEDFMMRRLQQP